jgi:hypothetical protein
MKKIKSYLRAWIATASIVGFLFGWVMFAHSAKPASINNQSAQAANQSSSSQVASSQSFIPLQQSQASAQIRLRTGGS